MMSIRGLKNLSRLSEQELELFFNSSRVLVRGWLLCI